MVDQGVRGLRLVPVDVLGGDDLLGACLDVALEHARQIHGKFHTQASLQEVQAKHRTSTDHRRFVVAAILDGEVVGTTCLAVPLLDNLHLASAWIVVGPRWRRRGIGTTLLAHVEELAASEQRTTLLVGSDGAVDGPDPAEGFGRRHGLLAVQVRYRSDLDLTGPDLPDALRAAEEEGLALAEEYDLLTWWDGPPAPWLEQRAALNEQMSTAPPLGGLDLHEQAWDSVRMLEWFRVQRAQGRRVVETVAVHRPGGQAVAFTTLVWSQDRPLMAFQRDTLVLTAHRGRRLGTLVKVANLRALQVGCPVAQRIATWNADDNRPMLRVNTALGFRPVGTDTSWQKTLV